MIVPLLISNMLLTEDNHKIAYHHYENNHKAVVVIAHGFFNSKDAVLLQDLKDELLDSYDVIMFDFRGHGKSSGLFSWTAKEAGDLEKVLEYAKAKYDKIGLISFSLGAAISIEVLSKQNSADSFIAVAAPSEFEKINFRWWKLDFDEDITYNTRAGRIGKGIRPGPWWLKKIKPIDVVGKITIPIFYIHGDKDWVIDYKHSERLFAKTYSVKDIKIIKGGSHAEYLMRKHRAEFVGAIRDWFARTL